MTLISWYLWKTLTSPPIEHPLIKHTIKLLTPKPRYGFWRVFEIIVGIIAVGIIGLTVLNVAVSYQDVFTWIVLLILNPNPIVLVYIPFFGVTLYTAPLNIRAAQVIRQKRDEKTYDFLCLLPCGKLIMTWLICLGCLHYRKALRNTHRFMRGLLILMLVILMLALGIQNAHQGALGLINTAANSLAFIFAVYFDYAQSVVLGSMIYLVYMTADLQPLNLFNPAGLTYFIFQIAIYAWSAWLFLSILPAAFTSVSLGGWLVDLAQLILWAILSLAAREIVISAVWWTLSKRFKTGLDELALMMAS